MRWIMHDHRSYKLQWQASATVKVTVLINFAEEKFERACDYYAQTRMADGTRVNASQSNVK